MATQQDGSSDELICGLKQHMTLNDKRKRTFEDDELRMDQKIRPLVVFSMSGLMCYSGEACFAVAVVITDHHVTSNYARNILKNLASGHAWMPR